MGTRRLRVESARAGHTMGPMADWIEHFTGRLPAWGEQLIIGALAVAIGVAAALIAHHVLFRVLRKVSSGSLSERSEEHTSELQSLMRTSYAVFCLKKKKQAKSTNRTPRAKYVLPHQM